MTDQTQAPSNSATMQIMQQVRNTLSQVFQANNQVSRDNAKPIHQAKLLLSDEESSNAYDLQLCFLATSRISPQLAENLKPLSKESWEDLIAQGYGILKQDNTFNLNCSIASERRNADICLSQTVFTNQYQYQDLVKVEKGDIFLDCGAYIGDSALWAYSKGASKVYSFEPCNENFADLKSNLAAHNLPTEQAFQLAVSNQKSQGKLCVFNYSLLNSRLDFQGLSSDITNDLLVDDKHQKLQDVNCISLDEWCSEHDVKPTFIKMDIEGAEFDALQGAAEIIKSCKPKLAINLSHRYQYLWSIPAYLHSLVPEYKFYCHKKHYKGSFILFAKV